MLNHLSPEEKNVKDEKKKGLFESVRPLLAFPKFITFQ